MTEDGLVQWVRCPACARTGPASRMLKGWDGETYELTCCGHRAHLGPVDEGGAENWMALDPAKASNA